VIATVRDSILNPVPSVVVTFGIISGPNAGLTGQATTDANGSATFSWSSQVAGTDTVQASIANATGGTITTTATKDWVPEVPGVPVGGYSFQIRVPTKTEPLLTYIALMGALTVVLAKLKPKTKRKH
jgi:hypothetical protein